ncbi:transcriptional regulator with XRE-family HTH domain [Pseudonocardia sediminis]|uniref:Transcriptional regulator with XRE-family HTH domain n=1 Tax=Pseudonocardia sediminis TaxID=1397368 RepID=A0A4Q7V2K7_PSEST|nr:helix-turn-helix transcriptional regulator [Pseudonocardia sediminis]RZT87714.1 transcriptional regulator with XRE-family HTH domain [Pseudonocardia sediminis]
MLRFWRARRRVSQMDLALAAGVSTRHLSFVETGRSGASRELLGALAEELEIPLRERNALLLAAGFAPAYTERPLDDDAHAPVRGALEQLMAAHDPNPALVVDRWGDVVLAGAAVAPLLDGVDPDVLGPPTNVYRLSLHPRGLAPRIRNLAQWREHLLHRLERQVRVTADPRLTALLTEVRAYPSPDAASLPVPGGDVLLPLQLDHPAGALSFHSTMTTFGAPHDVTLAELAVETFLPADDATREALRHLAASRSGRP